MTPNLLDELEKIVALSEKATKGEWYWNECTANLVTDHPGDGQEFEIAAVYSEHDDDREPANSAFIAASVNFLRTHAATLADMAKRLEAAERDAAKFAPCLWVQDPGDGSWDTACGNKHLFIDGDAADNLYQHCPYCGGHLVEPNYDAATQEGAG